MRGHHDALRRVLEVLTLGPCGPLLVKQSARLARALKAVDWTKLKKADWAQVRMRRAQTRREGQAASFPITTRKCADTRSY
jgi:hypothetical protein